ncbi:MAG: HNH endonuclease signature motif containing protein [Planctomycetota bacterium]
MSKDKEHGGSGWNFGDCLWSPIRKAGTSGRWGYWETIKEIESGDTILHIRKEKDGDAFVGSSIADATFYITDQRPPKPGQWGYSTKFYRLPLKEYIPFSCSIFLRELFREKNEDLVAYYQRNKRKPSQQRRKLFYVVQKGRLQCQNGAYLTEIDSELANIILAQDILDSDRVIRDVQTGQQLRDIKARIGQRDFSLAVRENYGHRCCFPGCKIDDDRFLIAGHIARWVDAPTLRGSVSNGLCFCLLHDKAFEIGLFTLDGKHRVCVNIEHNCDAWSKRYLIPYDGHTIRSGIVMPSEEALRHHRRRVGKVRGKEEI